MSAFIRRQPARTVDTGTRPGLHGQVLISSGVAGIDTLLGGGLPLGCVMLVIEDAHSQQHLNLLRCFMGEGLCCKHSLAWITARQLDAAGTAAFLPDQAKSSSTGATSGSSSGGSSSQQTPAPGSSQRMATPTAVQPAQPPPAAAAQPDDGLRIAWQYRKYIQAQQRADDGGSTGITHSTAGSSISSSTSKHTSSSSSSAAKALAAGIGREWCHHFDFSRSLTPEQVQASRLELHCIAPPAQQQQQQQQQGCGSGAAVRAAAAAAAAFVARFQPMGPIPVPSRDPGSVGRLVLESLGSHEWWPHSSSSSSSGGGGSSGDSTWQELESAMLAAVAGVRLAVQDASCAAFITCPAGLYSEAFQAHLQHLADVVLCVQSLADNTDVYRLLPDPTSASALLEVRRLPPLGLLRPRHADEALHLLRTRRRSITVAPLQLLPLEAVAAGGAAAGAAGPGGRASRDGAQAPAAALACGASPGGGAGALEF